MTSIASGMVPRRRQYRSFVLPFRLLQVLRDRDIYNPHSLDFDSVRAAMTLHGQQYIASSPDRIKDGWPIVLSLSHAPLRRVPPTTISVHGHLHAAEAASDRQVNAVGQHTHYAPTTAVGDRERSAKDRPLYPTEPKEGTRLMTSAIDEQQIDANCYDYYMVGCFDMLRQAKDLSQVTTMPTNDREEQRAKVVLGQAILPMLALRGLFEIAFKKDGTIPRWFCFSDTNIVSVRRARENLSESLAGIRNVLLSTSLMWLCTLSKGNPIRGGIEVGLAARITPTEVYGPPLVEAHRLESKLAKFPRIVVGPEFVRYLENVIKDPKCGADRDIADSCLSMLIDSDNGCAMLDSLCDQVLDLAEKAAVENVLLQAFPDAHERVRDELKRATDEELISRYKALLCYFDGRAEAWTSRTS